jgi:ADP-ribose pyrophosphatase
MSDVIGEVVVCAAFRDGEFLLMKRAPHKSSSGKWEFPGGRVEENEDVETAAVRELEEETGFEAEPAQRGESYLTEAELGAWRCHPFVFRVEGDVETSDEHVDYNWVEPDDVNQFDTIGELQALKTMGFDDPPQRSVKAVTRLRGTDEYLILKRSPDRRRCPGLWESPGGLVEEGEAPREAALRELREETGLEGEIIDSHQPSKTISVHGQFKVHPFLVEVDRRDVELSSEHTRHSWVKRGEPGQRDTLRGYKRELEAFR